MEKRNLTLPLVLATAAAVSIPTNSAVGKETPPYRDVAPRAAAAFERPAEYLQDVILKTRRAIDNQCSWRPFGIPLLDAVESRRNQEIAIGQGFDNFPEARYGAMRGIRVNEMRLGCARRVFNTMKRRYGQKRVTLRMREDIDPLESMLMEEGVPSSAMRKYFSNRVITAVTKRSPKPPGFHGFIRSNIGHRDFNGQ